MSGGYTTGLAGFCSVYRFKDARRLDAHGFDAHGYDAHGFESVGVFL